MPEMNGIEVLQAVRAHDPLVYVILMTGYANVDIVIEAVNYGAYAFFRKPLNFHELMETVWKIEKELTNRGKREEDKPVDA